MQRSRIQIKAQTRRITGSAHQPCGVILKTLAMEQPQAAAGQIGLTAIGIEEIHIPRAGAEHQGHRIHTEIATGQIVLQGARTHAGIAARSGVVLTACGGQIQQPGPPLVRRQVQLHLHRAKAAVGSGTQLHSRSQNLAQLLKQRIHKLRRLTFQHQIEVR